MAKALASFTGASRDESMQYLPTNDVSSQYVWVNVGEIISSKHRLTQVEGSCAAWRGWSFPFHESKEEYIPLWI